jgi:hypothetical protein
MHGSLAERLRSVVRHFARQYTNERVALMMPVLLDVSRRDPELAGLMRTLDEARRRPLRTIIAQGIADRALRPDTDLDVAHAQLIGPLVFRRLISGEELDTEFCDKLVRDFLTVNAL